MTNEDDSGILKLTSVFNSIGKFVGFAIIKPNDTLLCKSLREIVLSWYLFLSLCCVLRSELWCIQVLNMGLDVRKLVVFVIAQIVILTPTCCLLFHRKDNKKFWKIILKLEHLEKSLYLCNQYLEIILIGSCGLFFCFFHIFTILGVMYYSLYNVMFFFIIDSIFMFYYEVWVAIPYLQFVGWISLLNYVLHRVQLKIKEFNKLDYLVDKNSCIVNDRVNNMTFDGYDFNKLRQIKRIIYVMKQVLNISNELSSAYGLTVLIFIVHYLSRVILQFYDLIDKDAQQAPLWVNAINVLVRILFVLPVFICCECLSCNVDKTVELIREVVTLHQPSCLDCIFQSLTLRLQHRNATIKICGFLNITYSSFLTIMTTAIAFLVFQLQF